MWGRHRKRTARLPKQLALGLLEDAMGRAEQKGPERQGGPKQPGGPEQQGRPEQQGPEQQGAPERQAAGELAQAAPYPGAAAPQAVPSTRSGLEPADVRADTSAGPAADEAVPRQRQCGDERTGKSTRHGSLG